MSFEGLRTYTGDEVGNIVIGQMGYAILTPTAGISKGSGDVGEGAVDDTDRTFVAIKVFKNGSASIVGFLAESLIGDSPLTITDVSDGDIIYGPFKYVKAIQPANFDARVIAYYGNSVQPTP